MLSERLSVLLQDFQTEHNQDIVPLDTPILIDFTKVFEFELVDFQEIPVPRLKNVYLFESIDGHIRGTTKPNMRLKTNTRVSNHLLEGIYTDTVFPQELYKDTYRQCIITTLNDWIDLVKVYENWERGVRGKSTDYRNFIQTEILDTLTELSEEHLLN